MILAKTSQCYDEKLEAIYSFLENTYWQNDVWHMDDEFFYESGIRERNAWITEYKRITFTEYNDAIKNEVKYIFAMQLTERILKLRSLISYGQYIHKLARFLNDKYPSVTSFYDLPYQKTMNAWEKYLSDSGLKYQVNFISVLSRILRFYHEFYDDINEYDKDIWNAKRLSGIKVGPCATLNLNFTSIPDPFKELTKRYMKTRLNVNAYSTARVDLWGISLFLRFIHSIEPEWEDLQDLSREHMEKYLTWCREHNTFSKSKEPKHLWRARKFLEYIQLADYKEAPKAPVQKLLFQEDVKNSYNSDENKIKYIPASVLQQLEEKLECIHPAKYIPVVILLRATGWRISDIMNLRYDKCLQKTDSGWYLCGDIPKTGVLNHKVPISEEVAAIVQTVINKTKDRSTKESNPDHLLFFVEYGPRRGLCYSASSVRVVLNKFAKRQNIVDDNGDIFHFRNHAFRHTKGVELINNGMSLLHVQKWMAHLSPEMTLVYAKILDNTLRKSWEEATKQGLFRIDERGSVRKIDISELENEDQIEWEYIRYHLDAVRMPLGYCMKPKKQECRSQLNPCLTCRNLCTTPEFIPQYEVEMLEVTKLIEIGKSQGRDVWVEKNTILLNRYEEILSVLNTGKTRHNAGKSGREMVGEERSHES